MIAALSGAWPDKERNVAYRDMQKQELRLGSRGRPDLFLLELILLGV